MENRISSQELFRRLRMSKPTFLKYAKDLNLSTEQVQGHGRMPFYLYSEVVEKLNPVLQQRTLMTVDEWIAKKVKFAKITLGE